MSLPVAISVGTYDRILSLPYVYHGPVIDVPFLPIQLRFRGRPLHEWIMLCLLVPVLWVASDLVLGLLAAFGLSSLVGLGYAMAHVGVTWCTASWLAGLAYRKLISTDESFAYLATTAWTEGRRIVWARGPVDWWVAGIGLPVWFMFEWALSSAIHINEIALMVAAAVVVRPVVRRLVHAFEPPERARRRTIEHAVRRGFGATIVVSGEPRAEAPQAA